MPQPTSRGYSVQLDTRSESWVPEKHLASPPISVYLNINLTQVCEEHKRRGVCLLLG